LSHHTFGKFDARKPVFAVNRHFRKELEMDERIDVIDALIIPVEGEGVEIKVNRVGKVKIS
jgi:hypothetical protein